MIGDVNVKIRTYTRIALATPFIYAVFIPLALLDISMELYHHIAFPLYGLPRLERSQYIVFDRHKLSYLTYMEKVNCVYCSYANGLLAYAKAIAAETEKMWCPIKHKWHPNYRAPEHHASFADYNDEELLQEYMLKREQEYSTSEAIDLPAESRDGGVD